MQVPEVQGVLGTVKTVERAESDTFRGALQQYIDSTEKTTTSRGEEKEIEFWPLIEVVRIYTKSKALSTGAMIVDLPGWHDSNAARADVADRYMQKCTGESQWHV